MAKTWRGKGTVCIFLSCWLALGPQVLACSVPVFRYALERWPADAYTAVVFHRGKLAKADQAVVDWLKKASTLEYDRGRLAVVTVDLDGDVEKRAQELWKAQAKRKPTLPWMVVLYPPFARIPVPAWAGPLTTQNAKRLLDSPARRAVAKRILEGESAVWILLESGDRKQDDAAAKLLDAKLKKAMKLFELPQLFDPYAVEDADEPDDPEDPQDEPPQATVEVIGDQFAVPGGPKLRLAFSMFRLSRTDQAEELFISMLLHTEEDLWTFKEPMAMAFFGRERLLWTLVGKGINEDNILETCAFLAGPCACTIKYRAPGVDMLTLVDWDAAFEGEEEQKIELPPLVGLPDATTVVAKAPAKEPAAANSPSAKASATVERPTSTQTPAVKTPTLKQRSQAKAEAAAPTPPAPQRAVAEPSSFALARNIAIAVVAALAILAGAALVMMRKPRYPQD